MKWERSGTIALWIIAILFAYEVIFNFNRGIVFILWDQYITQPREAEAKERADLQDAKNYCDPKAKPRDYKFFEGGYVIHPDGRIQYIWGEPGRRYWLSTGEEECMSRRGYDLKKGKYLKKKKIIDPSTVRDEYK